MGKVIFRLPSKGTQYGYAEYHFDTEEDINGHGLGVLYKHFVDNFQRGEAAGQAESRAVAAPKQGDVLIAALKSMADDDARKDVLDEQFGSNFREPTEEEAKALIVEKLGASVYDEEVDEQTPEWETPPPPASDDDWDF